MIEGLFARLKIELDHWRRRHWAFEDVAAHWDATEDYDDINAETYSYFRRFTDGLKFSDIPEGARALDICARTGNGAAYFYQQGKIAQAVCAGVSFRMGEICSQRLRDTGLEKFLWVPIRDYELPFADDSFDVILFFETIEHFPEPRRFLRELCRVARPGGVLILTTPNVLWEPVHALAAITNLHHSEGPHRFIPYRRLKRLVRSAGFGIERAETTVLIPGGPKPLVKFGEWLEKRTRGTLMPLAGLRRVIIGRKF
jgi:ubiquinone/menaquinone biosynthesis C-methylase UbiE